jgi:hypothetical protein
VHNATVALTHDSLVFEQLQQFNISFEEHGDGAGSLSESDDVAFVDHVLLIDMDEGDLDVLARTSKLDLFVLVVEDATDLSGVARRLHLHFVTDADGTLFDLAVSDYTLLLNLVEDGHAEGTLRVSLLNREFVDNLHQGFSLVPRAPLGVDLFHDVITDQTGDGNIKDVFGRVA